MQQILALIERFVVAHEKIAAAMAGGVKASPAVSTDKPAATESKETAAQKKKREADEKAAADAKSKSDADAFPYDTLKGSIAKLVALGPNGVAGIKSVLGHYKVGKADQIPTDQWEEANGKVLAKIAEVSAPEVEASDAEFA